MSKHMPGPWKATGWCIHDEHRRPVGGAHWWDGNEDYAEELGASLEDVITATACLMAAAPELLESLKWALLRIKTSNLGEGDHFEKAEVAIAKAEGRE